jgi:hypothetical protein
MARSMGVVCDTKSGQGKCVMTASAEISVGSVLDCPQLPALSPQELAQGRAWSEPPPGWTCAPEKYYELACVLASKANCDCGCGVIDPVSTSFVSFCFACAVRSYLLSQRVTFE